jgi:hypothetical protein
VGIDSTGSEWLLAFFVYVVAPPVLLALFFVSMLVLLWREVRKRRRTRNDALRAAESLHDRE